MIYISLPLLYYNMDFNNKLYNFSVMHHINDLFNIDLKINSFHGSFPFSIWNGGMNLNVNDNNFTKYMDLLEIVQKPAAPLRLDCSNILIQTEDLNNTYQNLILKLAENYGNFIEISDFDMINYINEHYENYRFIFSKNAHYKYPFTIDILNIICEKNIFYLIEIPNELLNDIDFLTQLKYKNQIEIPIATKCSSTCTNCMECILQEQQYILSYSGKTMFQNCKYLNKYIDSNLIDEIKYYQNLGFNHFKIDTPILNKNNQFQNYLIKNLIKDEYQLYYNNIIQDK